MTTLEELRDLRGTALRLLPGFCQARDQMDLAVEVLEYFAREAERELETGQIRVRPWSSQMAKKIGGMQSLINSFVRLHQPPQAS